MRKSGFNEEQIIGKTATSHAPVLELGQSELQTGLGPRGNVTPIAE